MHLFVSILMVLILAVPGGAEARARDAIKIGAIFAHTGAAAPSNQTARQGVKFAVEELNRQGGVLGRPLKLIEYDNKSKTIPSKKAAQQAVRDGVMVVIGANWSSHSMAMAPVLEAARIPMISPYSTHPDLTPMGEYIFRVCFVDSFQGKVMADYAQDDLKAKTAVIFVNATRRYSEGLARFFSQRFSERGGSVLLSVDYLDDTTIFTSQLEAILPLNPDVVFIPGNNIDSGRIIDQARKMGMNATFLGGDGWGLTLLKIAGTAAQGAYFSVHWHVDSDRSQSRRFVSEFRNRYLQDPDSGTAMAYDAVYIFARAAARAKTLEPVALRHEIARTINFEGVTGNISFDREGNPVKPAVIMTYAHNKKAYVKTVLP